MRVRFSLRLLRRALMNRLGKALTAVLAVAMGTSLICASLSVGVGMRARMREALRAYGANILLVPASDPAGAQLFASMPEDALNRVGEVARELSVLAYAPLLYTIVNVGAQPVVLVGTWAAAMRQVNPWWRTGEPGEADGAGADAAIVGSSLAAKLGVAAGSSLSVTAGGRDRILRVVGTVTTGGSDDEQVFVALHTAQELTGRFGQLSAIQVSAATTDQQVERIASRLEQELAGVVARAPRRLVMAEERLLARLSALSAFIGVLVLGASMLAVAASAATNVLERMHEIGVMKALGAGRTGIAMLLLTEASVIGILGGILGGLVGAALAQAIAHSVFRSTISLSGGPLSVAVVLGACVACLASWIPVRRATRVEPIIVLRGE